jgi:hypothetical protein
VRVPLGQSQLLTLDYTDPGRNDIANFWISFVPDWLGNNFREEKQSCRPLVDFYKRTEGHHFDDLSAYDISHHELLNHAAILSPWHEKADLADGS